MTTKQRVLVVDDEADIRSVVELYLRREGFEVETAADGEAAINAVMSRQPDLIVLDLMMPKMSGYEVTRAVREQFNIPIIMLTSREEESDKIVGLEMGADDYVTKPFSPRELAARVKAVLRRGGPSDESKKPAVISSGAMQIDPTTRLVTLGEREIELTVKEFDLLMLMAKNPGQVFSRDEILNKVWGYDFYGDTSTVTVHIRRLREKIEADPANPEYVLTVWGVGYKFAADL